MRVSGAIRRPEEGADWDNWAELRGLVSEWFWNGLYRRLMRAAMWAKDQQGKVWAKERPPVTSRGPQGSAGCRV